MFFAKEALTVEITVLLRFVPNLDPDLDLDDLDLDLDPRSSQTLDLPQIW